MLGGGTVRRKGWRKEEQKKKKRKRNTSNVGLDYRRGRVGRGVQPSPTPTSTPLYTKTTQPQHLVLYSTRSSQTDGPTPVLCWRVFVRWHWASEEITHRYSVFCVVKGHDWIRVRCYQVRIMIQLRTRKTNKCPKIELFQGEMVRGVAILNGPKPKFRVWAFWGKLEVVELRTICNFTMESAVQKSENGQFCLNFRAPIWASSSVSVCLWATVWGLKLGYRLLC